MVSWSICSPERHGLRRYSNLVAKERENTPLSDGHVEMSANVHNFWKMSTKENLPIFKFFPQNNKIKNIKFSSFWSQMSSNVIKCLLVLFEIKFHCLFGLILARKSIFSKSKKNFLKKKSRHQNFSNKLFFFSGLPRNF